MFCFKKKQIFKRVTDQQVWLVVLRKIEHTRTHTRPTENEAYHKSHCTFKFQNPHKVYFHKMTLFARIISSF